MHLIPPHIDDLIHGQISLRHWAATRSALFERARERPVECVCECLFLARSIGRVATRVDAGRPEFVHEVPHRQSLPNAFASVLFTPGVKDDYPFGHQERGKRNVGCDGNIAEGGVLRDVAVGHVRPALDADSRHVRVSGRKRETLVCHKDSCEREPLRGAKADFLHGLWGGVGVDPERHDHELVTGYRTRERLAAFAGWRKIILRAIVGTQ